MKLNWLALEWLHGARSPGSILAAEPAIEVWWICHSRCKLTGQMSSVGHPLNSDDWLIQLHGFWGSWASDESDNERNWNWLASLALSYNKIVNLSRKTAASSRPWCAIKTTSSRSTIVDDTCEGWIWWWLKVERTAEHTLPTAHFCKHLLFGTRRTWFIMEGSTINNATASWGLSQN